MLFATTRFPFSNSISDSVLEQNGGLLLEATTTFGALFRTPVIREYPALHMALRTMASPASRRQKILSRVLQQDAEVQGIAAALVALHAQIVVVRPMGERYLSLNEYFDREGGVLKPGETVRSFFLSKEVRHTSVYQSMDYLRSGQAVCGVALWAQRTHETLQEARVVLAGCTPHPVLLSRVSASLRGQECTSDRIEEATRKLGEERLTLYNPSLTLGSHLFNLSKTLIKRALLTL